MATTGSHGPSASLHEAVADKHPHVPPTHPYSTHAATVEVLHFFLEVRGLYLVQNASLEYN